MLRQIDKRPDDFELSGRDLTMFNIENDISLFDRLDSLIREHDHDYPDSDLRDTPNIDEERKQFNKTKEEK
jgi:hypothetical protein